MDLNELDSLNDQEIQDMYHDIIDTGSNTYISWFCCFANYRDGRHWCYCTGSFEGCSSPSYDCRYTVIFVSR